MCGILFNFVPTSGHPGGSLSSGRIIEGLLYNRMDYNFTEPDWSQNDILAYAAGHKAMGLYAMYALRNELIRVANPSLLAPEKRQLRFEDLLGFRRNPTQETPLFKQFHCKALDGHPSCIVPFVKTATGPSGIGVPAAFGMALGAFDLYPDNPPIVNVIEGEGGMTPGRVHEALAAASSAQLFNIIMHVDWNQSSIDSDRVTAEVGKPGDYVQWTPPELLHVHDWNVIFVPEGHNYQQIFAAQQLAYSLETKIPTAIVYRTVKGWSYGITGKGSHGAGHKFCSDEFYQFISAFEKEFNVQFPRFNGDKSAANVEKTFWDTLTVIRDVIGKETGLSATAVRKITESRDRMIKRNPQKRADAPILNKLYANDISPEQTPPELALAPGKSITLRAQLASVMNYLNKKTGGAIIGTAADLFGSTSISGLNDGFPKGWFNAATNPGSRLLPVGGICEDAMGAFMHGLSSYRNHIGMSSSYSAFIAAMEHTAARCHAIGQQNYWEITGEPFMTWIMVNGHAGPKTGEDGPTHADPQAFQLLLENFPKGKLITLTPWDAQDMWPLVVAALKLRPAILAPFVSRPEDIVVDRDKLKLPKPEAVMKGVYAFRKADPNVKSYHGTLVLQGNAVATIFINEVIQKLDAQGVNMNVYYISSAEMFEMLPPAEQEALFPEQHKMHAFGMTDFTLPTMYKWIRSDEGLRRTLHPFRMGHYLGSGTGAKVLEEAGIHADGQLKAILDYAKWFESRG
jgi:transketolase